MSIVKDIDNLLNTALAQCPNIPKPIAWPNINRQYNLGDDFVCLILLPSAGQRATLSGKQIHKGICQINVYTQTNTGLHTQNDYCDELYKHFKNNLLSNNETSVSINTINKLPSSRQDAWFVGGIEMIYNAYEI